MRREWGGRDDKAGQRLGAAMRKLTHLSLFSGSGIGTLAAQQAGIVTVAHTENDPACCFCLERMWPAARLFRDVRDVTAESVADLGPIDIISGGFPCQDVSTAGKGEGLGTEENPTRSGLWYEFARVIRETRPTWVLIENVPALRVRGGDRVTDDLEAMAYEWEASVVGADDVGAPHRRKRVWIVGRLENAESARFARGSCGVASDDQRQRENGSEVGAGFLGGVVQSSALANPILQPIGSGRPESERGQEGRTSAGGAGDGGELADSDSTRLEIRPEPENIRGNLRDQREAVTESGIGVRWPSRPGQPQHDWEAPRLVEFQLGGSAHGLARRIYECLANGDGGVPRQRAAKEIGKVESRTNKAMLKAIGNGWCYPVAAILFRWIADQCQQQEQEEESEPEESQGS